MIVPSGAVRVLVATQPIDFRKGMDGLAALVRERLSSDPFLCVGLGSGVDHGGSNRSGTTRRASATAVRAATHDAAVSRRAIDASDATTPTGVRDRAIVLLFATTGIRNKELRSLVLEDVRWRDAQVQIRRTKGRHDRAVPLLQEAGKALADYILRARPDCDSRRVFLQHRPPVRPIDDSGVISRIVRSALRRAGIVLEGPAGAHLIRHSLATRLVSRRRPINEIADLLGHRSIDTTAIYVKVSLPQLADVALPFPGGA